MDGASLRIERPSDLEPVGEALSLFGVGLTLVDREMRVCWANRNVLGVAEELSCGGGHCFATLWKSSHRCPDCLPLLVFRTGEPQEGLRERGRPGGPVEAYRVRAVPVLDRAGARRWVAESFLKLPRLGAPSAGGEAAVTAAAGAAAVVVDVGERIVSWGPAAVEVLGYRVEEVLGRRVDLIVPEELVAEEREVAARIARDGVFPRTETRRRARDGRLVPVALSAVALRDEAGALIGRLCTLEDLSALHQLRGRLAAQEQLLAHVTREAAEAILGVDREGRVTGFNRAAEGLLGVPGDLALGRPLAEVTRDPGAAALLEQVHRAGVVRGARTAWRRAGEEIPVEVSAASLAEGGVALVARDVSSQRELERRMMRSEKLAVVGSLAAGLAHEIGTPLNVISATAEYLMLEPPPADRERRLREIVGETDRISRLVRELLTFARGRGTAREPVDVRGAVEQVVSLLELAAEKKRIQVEIDVGPEVTAVLADRDGLHQVLVNLLVNAVNAVSEGGRVRVRARPAGGEAGVAIEVEDDGPGVAEALRERIFDPFFTTRADGTGLGLAVCARIVASYGGDVRVGGGPLGGACFTVQLPAADGVEP